ncbi:MAG: hypothetical protein M0P13_10605 [Fibrobacteraceae bacterium]|nr:hypothetical protein [Fibrobacteraceae bacterium]
MVLTLRVIACGSVIQPSKLGCATLALHGIRHFYACALVDATLACACQACRSGISAIKARKLVFARFAYGSFHQSNFSITGDTEYI